MNFRKVDRRMNGHSFFKHMAEFNNSNEDILKFCDVREWCWEQWGPSREYYFWTRTEESRRNPAYCWLNNDYNNRIYFATDKEAQWFGLRWM